MNQDGDSQDNSTDTGHHQLQHQIQFSPPPSQLGGGESNGGGGGSGSGSKRKRVSLACNACRTRKSKCDGVRPKCSMCRDLDFDCVYQQSASSSNTIIGKDYIGRLETRLLAVENLLAAQASESRLRNSPTLTAPNHDLNDDAQNRRSVSADGPPSKRTRIEGSNTPNLDANNGETFVNLKLGQLEDESSAQDTVLDGMGALNLGDEEDYGYFGPSSNIAFIGHVTRALATSVSVTTTFTKEFRRTDPTLDSSSRFIPPRNSPAPSTGGELDIRAGNVNIYVLPPQKRVLHYVTLYFQNTNILFPYLHQPSFLETYEEALRDGFSKVRRTWLALLNLVMAMGSRASTETDISAEEKYKTAEVFYQRGFGLCDGHFLRLASLDSVHLLLMMSHYLQSTRKPNQCWTTHGLAVRIALQLGLHSNQALQRFPPLERELRKRAWYGCVLLDRTLCMTFGRPSAIATYAEKLDLPLDVEDDVFKTNMSPVPVQPSTPTSVTFFILSIKLYTLLGMIIDTLYGGNLGGGDQVEPTFAYVARVAEIEEKLSTWRQQLPAALGIVSSSDIPSGGGPPSKFWRQSIILSLRYYNTRALLHRQFVVKGLSEIWGGGPSTNKFEGDFFWNFGWASIKVCAESAIETVEIIHKVKYRSDLLGFWWFTLYYTFNASLVLVSKVLIVSQVRQLALRPDFVPETASLLKHLEMAMETIEVLAAGNRIANRCRLFLKNLMRYVAPLATSSPRIVTSIPQPAQLPDRPSTDTPESSTVQNEPPQDPYQGSIEDLQKSPFRTQLGEFMLESDFTYLNSILPPLAMGDMSGMENGQPSSSGYVPNGSDYAHMSFGA
ncbi:fungal-specific transcription factor domain-containing protein [Tuber indicum]|nr:fungal-specific transcription factor domain-containing protein [Tuber indicum]